MSSAEQESPEPQCNGREHESSGSSAAEEEGGAAKSDDTEAADEAAEVTSNGQPGQDPGDNTHLLENEGPEFVDEEGSSSSPPQQHVVLVHVNPGEVFNIKVDGQIQQIRGPATVRMVSNSGPPLPIPMHASPGHVVQQVVDENGYLSHVILSPAMHGNPPPPPVVQQSGNGMNRTDAVNVNGNVAPGHCYIPPVAQPGMAGVPHGVHHHVDMGGAYQMPMGIHPPMHDMHPHAARQLSDPCDRSERIRNRLREKHQKQQERQQATLGESGDGALPQSHAEVQQAEEERGEGEGQLEALQDLLSAVPLPVVTEVGHRQAMIRLSPPEVNSEEFNIDVAKLEYDLQLQDQSRSGNKYNVYSGDATEITLEDLRPGSNYLIRVTCRCGSVGGRMSEAVELRTDACAPDRPLAPSYSQRTKTAITLKWGAVADNGSKLQGYVLQYDQGTGSGSFSQIFSGTQRQYKVTKLQASTGYVFRLAAVNEVGTSEWSEPVCIHTQGNAPSKPDPPMLADRLVRELNVSWIRRHNDDEFSLQMEDPSSGHGFIPIYVGSDLCFMVDKLRPNTEYIFRLKASNDNGSSQWSDSIHFRTLPGKPLPPTQLAVKGKVHPKSARLCWEKPRDDGGADVTGYCLEMEDGRGYRAVYQGPERECVQEQLLPGHSYSFRAKSLGPGGASQYTEAVVLSTPPVPPAACAPPRLQGKPKSCALHLRWSPPEQDGGAAVSEYCVLVNSAGAEAREAYRGRELDCVVAGLRPGTCYSFCVRALNKAGLGPWSNPAELSTGAGVPGAPSAPSCVCKTPHSAHVMWTEPASNGAAVSEYRLEMLKEDSYCTVYMGTELSFEVKSLLAATQYHFRVAAANSAGYGAPSEPGQGVTQASSPGAVTGLRASDVSAESARLSWRAPPEHGAAITAYHVDLIDQQISVGPELEYPLDNLQPETQYKVRVQAVNSVGVGAFSSTLRFQTRPLPPLPPTLECVAVSHNALKLRWTPQLAPRLTAPTHTASESRVFCLELMRDNGSWQPVYTGPLTSHRLTRLSELTAYSLRVWASNEAGRGQDSAILQISTSAAPPPAPKPPRFSEEGECTAVLEWSAVRGSGALQYVLQGQVMSGPHRQAVYTQLYRGADLCFRWRGLAQGAKAQARVCAVRQLTDDTELNSAYSPPVSFCMSSPEATPAADKRADAPEPADDQDIVSYNSNPLLRIRERMSDQQLAIFGLLCFFLITILIAFVVQKIVG